MRDTPNIQAAMDFAHKWHDYIGQKRKYSGAPYWVHTNEVADIVSKITWSPLDSRVILDDMICAAHGHDLLEDVVTWLEVNKPDMLPVFRTEYEQTFTAEAHQMIVGLTDVYVREVFPHLNRATRKDLERKRISELSPFVKTIKLADLISNTKSIVKEDKDFARVYIKEKLAVLNILADGSPELLQRASMQAVSAAATLGLTTNLS